MTSGSNGQELVVVGVDGSAESVRWAGRRGTSRPLVPGRMPCWPGTIPPLGQAPVVVAPDPVHKVTEARQLAILGEAIAKAHAAPADPRAEMRLGYGHPVQVLIDASREADLLVVGHRGHGAFTGTLLGSVSIRCVTGAFCRA